MAHKNWKRISKDAIVIVFLVLSQQILYKEDIDMALIGLRDLYIAILTNDSPESTVYAEPVRVVGAITANINPNSSSSTLFADDGPMDSNIG